MLFGEDPRIEGPIGGETQESKKSPTRINPSGCKEGNGFLDGMKSLKRRHEAFTGFVRKRRSGRGRVTFLRSSGRSKALKGKAYERWELK
jgi:hypothetical protein